MLTCAVVTSPFTRCMSFPFATVPTTPYCLATGRLSASNYLSLHLKKYLSVLLILSNVGTWWMGLKDHVFPAKNGSQIMRWCFIRKQISKHLTLPLKIPLCTDCKQWSSRSESWERTWGTNPGPSWRNIVQVSRWAQEAATTQAGEAPLWNMGNEEIPWINNWNLDGN